MPVRTNGPLVFSRTFVSGSVLGWTTPPEDPLLLGATLHLMGAAGFLPTPDAALDTLTAVEAAFSGYGATAVSWDGPLALSTTGMGMSGSQLFEANNDDPFIPDTVTGWWLQNQADDDWIAAVRFAPADYVGIGLPFAWVMVTCVLPQLFTVTAP